MRVKFDEFLDEKEKNKLDFFRTQNEKNFYLGEYKERVVAALQKDQVIEDDIYPEILDAMKGADVLMMKMSREIPFENLKPYIMAAEKLGVRYELVDGLAYRGDIGLVVISKLPLEKDEDDLIIRDMDQDFIDVGLGEIFSKNRGKKICKKCYNELSEKLPEYKDSFKKISIVEKLFGYKCPICMQKKKK